MGFQIVMTHPSGQRHVLQTGIRHYGSAVRALDKHVASKHEQFDAKALQEDRVVVGPDDLEPSEVMVSVVCLIGPGVDARYRYAVERA